MKKLTALLLALIVMLSMLMAACGGSDSGETDDAGKSESSKETGEALITDPVVVMDNENCKIVITEMEKFGDIMIGIKISYENKSADKAYTFTHDHAAVNGLELAAISYTDVEAGATVEKATTVYTSHLTENGVTDYTDIEIGFSVTEDSAWKATYEEIVHIYPSGEDKATKFVRTPGENDTVVIDNEYLTFVVLSIGEHKTRGYAVEAFFVNKTDKEIMIAFEDETVNGILIDPFFSTSVQPGNCSFNTIAWDTSKLEENGVTNVEEIGLTVRVYDNDDWLAEDFLKERITLNP